MLDRMYEERIFEIVPAPGGFSITERCDTYFQTILTADELERLGREIIAAAQAQRS